MRRGTTPTITATVDADLTGMALVLSLLMSPAGLPEAGGSPLETDK